MTRQRDYQRARLYAWERRRLREDLVPVEHREALPDLLAAQRFLDRCTDALGTGRVIVDVGTGARARGECRRPNWIRLPKTDREYAWRPYYLLHELAHALDWRTGGSPHHACGGSHGPRFVAMYRELLVRFLGVDRARLVGSLRGARIDCYERAGFPFSVVRAAAGAPPERARGPLSPAQRRVLERLPRDGSAISLSGREARSARVLVRYGLARAASLGHYAVRPAGREELER